MANWLPFAKFTNILPSNISPHTVYSKGKSFTMYVLLEYLSKCTFYYSGNTNLDHLPVTVVLIFEFSPTLSISCPFWILPHSILPVITVPRPAIEYACPIGNENGLSKSLSGIGIHSSTALSSLEIDLQGELVIISVFYCHNHKCPKFQLNLY